jgi:hypothetical protein
MITGMSRPLVAMRALTLAGCMWDIMQSGFDSVIAFLMAAMRLEFLQIPSIKPEEAAPKSTFTWQTSGRSS